MAVQSPKPAPLTNEEAVALATRLVDELGGRFSLEMGIYVDRNESEVDRWLLAATLFGTRISAATAVKTYRVMSDAGIATLSNVERSDYDTLVELLDRGGYTRYDFRTAARLQRLAKVVRERHSGRIATIGDLPSEEIARTLDTLPGWGPTTVDAFLREMRGVWPQMQPSISERAVEAAQHIGLVLPSMDPLTRMRDLAEAARTDLRDVETMLVRLWISHHRQFALCPGGRRCPVVTEIASRDADA